MGKKLHATNVRFMNDPLEIEYPISVLVKEANQFVHDDDGYTNNLVKSFYNDAFIPRIKVLSNSQFTLSFSFEQDSLHSF